MTYIRNEADRHRQDCLEDILTIFLEAVELDYAFLLSKGEDVFIAFLTMCDNFYLQAFSMKTKILCIQIIVSIFTQLTPFATSHDSDFMKKQSYERKKLSY